MLFLFRFLLLSRFLVHKELIEVSFGQKLGLALSSVRLNAEGGPVVLLLLAHLLVLVVVFVALLHVIIQQGVLLLVSNCFGEAAQLVHQLRHVGLQHFVGARIGRQRLSV